MTQYDRILRHLKDYKTITSWQAITEYGITRLSAVIYLLRKDGYQIESKDKTSINIYGDKVSFAEYNLKG